MYTSRVVVRLAVAACCLFGASQAHASEWFVAPGGTGMGTAAAPFGRIQQAINAAQPGDVISVAGGTYAETMKTVRGGTPSLPITIRRQPGASPAIVTAAGRVFTVSHPFVTLDGLILDGQYGADDIVRIATIADGTTLRNCEIRASSKDGVDMAGPSNVLIDGCLIHHTLNAADGRTDAHGIVAGPVHHLTIRNTEIHTFSGDGFQVDPSRDAPGWDDVRIENCRIWLAPLAQATNGFAKGVVPGENAVDTKSAGTLSRARITIRNTDAWGFRGGLISNMAAFNMKENIDAVIDGTTVRDSEIAFRLRGGGTTAAGAWVQLMNAVVYDTTYAIRYEDNIQNLRVWNVTLGRGITRPFVNAGAKANLLDVRNLVLLGLPLTVEAPATTNLSVTTAAFVDVANGNYQLAEGSSAIDRGVPIDEVRTDRQGTARPQGAAHDMGAYERAAVATPGGPGDAEVVLLASASPVVAGNWSIVNDPTAAGGARIASADLAAPTVTKPLAAPSDYFEMTFDAEAGRPYRLWMRGKAEGNSKANDAVWVQFSDAITDTGKAAYRIGSGSAAQVNLEDCIGCGLSGWGWQDNGDDKTLGSVIYFAKSGTHTIRVQIRQDGSSIDQIVLSSSSYLTISPGALKNDGTILK